MYGPKKQELVDIVKRWPRRTAKEYSQLAGRPHPSIRRDLASLAKMSIVCRTRNLKHYMSWDGTWEIIK